MSECGLIDSSGSMQLTLGVTAQYPLELIYDMKLLKSNNIEEKKIIIPIYKLTQTGQDILSVVADNYDENYLQDVANYLAKIIERLLLLCMILRRKMVITYSMLHKEKRF